MKSNATKSDLIAPLLSAAVQGWSPSRVRRRMVTSVALRFVDIDQARLLERLAHVVHVEPEHTGGELLAFGVLVGVALLALCHDIGGILAAEHHHPGGRREQRNPRGAR